MSTPARPVTLVTGASAGIGAATARLAARAGYDLALAYGGNTEGAEAVAAEVRDAGGRAVLFRGDLTDPAWIETLYDEFDAAFPRLDVLVNNAGVVDVAARVEEFTHRRLRRMFDTNLIAPILVAGQAVRRMSTRHGGAGGAIVNVSSVAARLGSGGQYADYAASKAGIDAFTKGLADEVAGEGIRVVALRPGVIETEIHAKGGIPDRAARLASQIPMGRPGTAEECAEAILWLASDKASYVTGTTLDVTGGR